MNTETEEISKASGKSRTYQLTCMALMAAVICILAPMSIPIGPIPISLTNLALLFSLYILGWKYTTVSFIVYLLLGMVGMPVFSGFRSGMGVLFGPTGGYLIGFIPMVALAGIVIARTSRRLIHIAAMAAGTVLVYLIGTVWYCFQAGVTFGGALAVCVIPFVPFDLLKILAVSAIGPLLNTRLKTAGLLT